MFDETRLRVFAAIAREGSITAAAGALHFAQPSVSHHLARIERDAGVPLVQRVGRGIRLTDAGRAFATRAEEILGRIDAAREELSAHAELRAGSIRIAGFPSILATLVPGAAQRFRAEHPEVALALTEAEPPEALARLRRGEVDVALAFHHDDGPAAEFDRLVVTPLLSEPMYVVTPAGRRFGGDRADLSTYAGERWNAGCDRCRAHLLRAAARHGFVPDVGFETDDYMSTQALVAAGIGVSTLPGLALRAHRHPGVRIDRLPADHRHVVAAVGGTPTPAPVAAFVDAVAAIARRPVRWPR
ncbi:MAG TPA: LysR substrate-binding domain-containing protein [Stackebrandtia sp.]|jgi:DNA-binding transcriptional LysR family regulator|uniref:LysR family transcriptional regulator n=1 Tax=Stackebrandtia sp. TaxID=2023065 RepID=UPI002D401C73|nr:LysR substrate-binding domain-containing protein [Stackebrandtia sp.]HZE38812.1 LysR substrate-binding domain-containing protein [Stackebrandtia sp.]